MDIYTDEIAPINLCQYAVFTYNAYNGVIHEPNWQAIDILLNREQVNVSPSNFNAYRHILAGFVDWVQKKQLEEMAKDG